jgi:hypothetical protein
MEKLLEALTSFSKNPIPILDSSIPLNDYVPLDLSKTNGELSGFDITDHTICQRYIDTVLHLKQGTVAYGGYLEQRNLYTDKLGFTSAKTPVRDIHLGIDFWATAGTKVQVPIDGTVHSYRNNNVVGDYGPTIILRHVLGTHTFYSLYGHLSLDSLDGLSLNKRFKAGETLGRLGTPDINVNYAPHLHFQLIKDLEGSEGDYPGVCAKDKLSFYRENCPDPNLLLKMD